PVLEVDAVPELLVNELAGVVEDADDAAALGQQLLAGFVELLLRLLQSFRAFQAVAAAVGALGEGGRAAVVVGLVVPPDVAAGVEVALHAPLAHGSVDLRPPRRARLPVAAWGDAEDLLHVGPAGTFAAVELGHAVVPAEVGQVHRGAGLDAVPVGV